MWLLVPCKNRASSCTATLAGLVELHRQLVAANYESDGRSELVFRGSCASYLSNSKVNISLFDLFSRVCDDQQDSSNTERSDCVDFEDALKRLMV